MQYATQDTRTIWIVIDSSGFGGIESHVFQLASGLHRENISVHVVFLNSYEKPHPLHEKLKHSGIPYFVLDGRFRTFVKTLRAARPILCHAHGYKAGLFTRFACRLNTIPNVSTYHAGEKSKGKLKVYDLLDRSTALLNTSNTAVSNEIVRRVYAPCKQLNNFIDTEHTQPTSGNQIAFVGRLSQEKSPASFIELSKRLPEQDFAIYGDGPLRSTLEKNTSKNCTFYGHVNMEDHWDDIKYLIICSEFEGLPLCLLEAMARGVIVIAYPLGQIPDVIQDTFNGFLAKKGDINDLTKTLKKARSLQVSEQDNIRSNAIFTIDRHYSNNAVLPQYISLYKHSIYRKSITAHTLERQETFYNTTITSSTNAKQVDETQPLTVLFVHFGEEWIRGSEVCLINLVTKLADQGIRPIVWCNSHTLSNALISKNITVEKSYFSILGGWTAPRFNIKNYFQLIHTGKTLIKKYKIDVVHTNNGAPNQWMVIAARATSTPIVTQLHAPYLLRDRISLSLHSPDKVVGVSHAVMAPFMFSSSTISNKHDVVHNGIDLSRYNNVTEKINIRDDLNIDDDSYVIVSVGSLIHRKGFDLLIDAVHVLIDQHSVPAHLIIVGDGPLKSELHAHAKKHGIEKCIHFLGEQSNVPEILSSNVDVFASGTRDEAFGLVFAEAGAANLASVAPSIGGVPEVVSHKQTGLLVEPESSTALANSLHSLYQRPIERICMGNMARQRVNTLFNLEKNVDAFHKIYLELNETRIKTTRFDALKAYLSPLFSCVKWALRGNV